MCALVVENDPVFAKLIDAALKSEGIISEPAETGEDTIDLAKNYLFDVMILNFRLPDIKGPRWCGGCARQGCVRRC
jgi:two-component system, cell cycle response regulator CtrA